MTDIGSKLKTFRRSKGFSQEGLAAASGISIRTIQRIEKGLSVGNGFTLNALAQALDIEIKDLAEQALSGILSSDDKSVLKILNLSAACVVVLPLSNVIIPAVIFWKNRDNASVNSYGRKILSFQILWTLTTMLLMIVVPVVLLFLFKSLKGGSIPLAVPVYVVSVILNVCVTIALTIKMDGRPEVIDSLPNIL